MKPSDRETADFSNGRLQAIIDIGSNTVRLVIYGGSWRAPTVLLNEKVAARLGSELAQTGLLGDESIDIALAGLARYATLLAGLAVSDIQVVATAAVRDAANGSAFLDRVRALGLKPRLLSGPEEAVAAAMGVRGAFPRGSGLVADLGGGSLELVGIDADGCHGGASLPLGVLRLQDLHDGGIENFRRVVAKALSKAKWRKHIAAPIYLVGGTWRSLATYALRQSKCPLDDPHGLELDAVQARALAGAVALATPEQLGRTPGVSAMRAAVLPYAADLLTILMDELQPTGLVFSSWGLREGLLYQRLDPVARMQDPLLAGVAAFAAPRGGNPALATRVAGWTVSAVPASGRGSERLRLVSTMLALASSQIEPNFRARHSIDWALHKRWIDLDREGRAIIATVLAAYAGLGGAPEEIREFASPDMLREAIAWGLAIRLCRRLGANSLSSLEASALVSSKGRLELFLGESHAALLNRGVEKDLARLAAVLELEPRCEVIPDLALQDRRYSTEYLPELY